MFQINFFSFSIIEPDHEEIHLPAVVLLYPFLYADDNEITKPAV
jgi:hypothetical protein